MSDEFADVPTSAAIPVTVEQLDALVEEIFNQKAKIEDMEGLVSLENKHLATLEQKAVRYLEELGRENYKTPRGSIGVSEKWRFNLPAGDEAKQAFFEHLKSVGLYDRYATVHSAAYNSYCLAEWEIAKQEGRGMEFSLPGVPEPKLFKALSTRKGR